MGLCEYFPEKTTISSHLLGAVSIRKTVLPGMAIPMLKIRRPNGRLIFNMEIAIRILRRGPGHHRAKIWPLWSIRESILNTQPISVHTEFDALCQSFSDLLVAETPFWLISRRFLSTRGPQLGQYRSKQISSDWGITFSDNGRKSRTDGRTHGRTIKETIAVHVDIPVTFIFWHYLDLIRRACRHFLTVKRCISEGTDYRSCKDPSWSISTSEVIKGCYRFFF